MKNLIILGLLSLSTMASGQEIDFNYSANVLKVFKAEANLHFPYSQIDLMKQKEELSIRSGKQCLNFVKGLKSKWEAYALKNDFAINDLSISVKITDPRFLDLDARSSCEEKYNETGSVSSCSATFDCHVNVKSLNAKLFVGEVQVNRSTYINHPFSKEKTEKELVTNKKECEELQLELAEEESSLYVQNMKNGGLRNYTRDLRAYHYNCHNNVLKLKQRIY